MRRIALLGAVLAAGLLLFLLKRGDSPPTQSERNRAFSASMSGVVLIGNSTQSSKEGISREERYYLDRVTHLSGDTWMFQTRLKYGEQEIPVPIPITVQWAGDTPVITLTDLSIPGVGTFTARVVLYRNQYAGTWSGKAAGGQLFGRIERQQGK